MKHHLTRDERRARARVVCAGIGLGMAALGGALWLARPTPEPTRAGGPEGAKLEAAAASRAAAAPGVTTLEEVRLYGTPGGRVDLDGLEMTLRETTPSIPEGAMFEPEVTGAPEGAVGADAIVRHEVPLSPGRERDEASGSSARRALERGARAGGARARAAQADDYNETVVKRASFRSCWEADPAGGKVSVKIRVDPGGGVSVYVVAARQVPEAVVRCVAARARALPLRVSPDGGPRTFDVSSSYSRQLM